MNLNLQISILVVCLVTAFLLVFLNKESNVATDTLLGILAHSTLAIGIVVLAVSSSTQVNIEAYLFGELLTISLMNLIWVVSVSIAVMVVLYKYWNQFLSVTVNEELAIIEGVNVPLVSNLIVLLMALITAVAMKIVGVLLITSLLIIPPAAARQISNSPEQMAIKAAILGSLSVILGLFCAFVADTPVGPSIVVIAAAIFFVLYFFTSALKKA